jgi:hypothetical protein
MHAATAAENHVEWMGTQIGVSNMMTRDRAPAKVRIADLDSAPDKIESLLASARRAMTGPELHIQDAVLHGIRARLHTNSFHLADFWRENFYAPLEWRKLAGRRPPDLPKVRLYAFVRIPEEPQAIYYARRADAALVFNTCLYGDLRAAALGAVERVLTEEEGTLLLEGDLVEEDGRRMLILGRPTSVYAVRGSRAFAVEKGTYGPTNVVTERPWLLAPLLKAHLENVSDEGAGDVEGIAAAALALPGGETLRALPRSILRRTIQRLAASEEARAILPSKTDPSRPMKLDGVGLDGSGTLDMSRVFLDRRLGASFRFADDRAEAEYVEMLQAVRERTGSASVYSVHRKLPRGRLPIPRTLDARIELFRPLIQEPT